MPWSRPARAGSTRVRLHLARPLRLGGPSRPSTSRHARKVLTGAIALVCAAGISGINATPVSAAPRTFYVDCAGNDGSNGTSSSTAWRSMAKANAATLAPGDKLLFKRGCTWTGPLKAKWNGTAADPITVGAYGTGNLPRIQNATNNVEITGSRLIIEHIYTRADPPGYDAGCQNQPAGWRVGFRFYSGASYNVLRDSFAGEQYTGILLGLGSHHNTILRNVLKDNDMKSADPNSDAGGVGIDVHGDDNEIAYNEISGSDICSRWFSGRDGSAISIYEGRRNSVHHNRSWQNNNFIELGHSRSADTTIAYNRDTSTLRHANFLVAHGQGTGYGPVLGTKAYGNTTYLTGAEAYAIQCIGTCSSSILSFHGNIVWSEDRIGYAEPGFDEGHNVYWRSNGAPRIWFDVSPSSRIANPRLVNPGAGDLHLQAGSPAIDSSSSHAVGLGFTTDLDGTPVPQSAAPDIGAYEVPAGNPTYASDGYQRTVSNGWGNAGVGGPYTLSGAAADFRVDGSTGIMTMRPGANRAAVLRNVSQRDVTISLRVRTDRLATGNGLYVYALARGDTSGNEYRIKIRISSARQVFIQATRVVGGTETSLGIEYRTSLTHSANAFIRLRAQLTGASPTTIRARAWADGASEPGTWQYSVTDSAGGLQDAGSVGLRSYQAGNASATAIHVGFDDLRVTRN